MLESLLLSLASHNLHLELSPDDKRWMVCTPMRILYHQDKGETLPDFLKRSLELLKD